MAWLSELVIFNVRTDADAWDCTGGLYGHRKTVCAGSGLCGKKSLAAPRTRTRVSIVPDVSAELTELSRPLQGTRFSFIFTVDRMGY